MGILRKKKRIRISFLLMTAFLFFYMGCYHKIEMWDMVPEGRPEGPSADGQWLTYTIF